MDSAPRDGSEVIVCEPWSDPVVGQFLAGKWWGPITDSYGSRDVLSPSHWQPLPPAPVKQEG